MNRVLVTGAPRSGTTWLAHVLGATAGTRLAHEPDNPAFHPEAAEAHALYGGYAAPHRGERWPAYERLWDAAFWDDGTAVAVVAKSVFAAFALEWLVAAYAPRIVLIERHPARVVASWMRLDFVVGDLATRVRIQHEHVGAAGLPQLDPSAPRIVAVSWAVGVLMSAMSRASHAHDDWTRVSHEWLSADPLPRLRSLAETLDLRWADDAERQIRALGTAETRPIDTDGDGIPIAWQRYPRAEAQAAMAMLRCFPALDPWLAR